MPGLSPARLLVSTAAMALIASLAACSSTPAQRDRALCRAGDALSRTHDPDALAAAGLLQPLKGYSAGGPTMPLS